MKYSIVYMSEGQIFKIGPFETEAEAMTAGRKAVADNELDAWDTHIYLLHGSLCELSTSDLGV